MWGDGMGNKFHNRNLPEYAPLEKYSRTEFYLCTLLGKFSTTEFYLCTLLEKYSTSELYLCIQLESQAAERGIERLWLSHRLCFREHRGVPPAGQQLLLCSERGQRENTGQKGS